MQIKVSNAVVKPMLFKANQLAPHTVYIPQRGEHQGKLILSRTYPSRYLILLSDNAGMFGTHLTVDDFMNVDFIEAPKGTHIEITI